MSEVLSVGGDERRLVIYCLSYVKLGGYAVFENKASFVSEGKLQDVIY